MLNKGNVKHNKESHIKHQTAVVKWVISVNLPLKGTRARCGFTSREFKHGEGERTDGWAWSANVQRHSFPSSLERPDRQTREQSTAQRPIARNTRDADEMGSCVVACGSGSPWSLRVVLSCSNGGALRLWLTPLKGRRSRASPPGGPAILLGLF